MVETSIADNVVLSVPPTDNNHIPSVPSVEDIWNDSIVREHKDENTGDLSRSPASLKSLSVQGMLENYHATTPVSLMQRCSDYISWNPDIAYPCSMILP